MKAKRTTLPLLVAFGFAITMVSCGDDEKSSDTTAAPETTTASSDAADTTAAADPFDAEWADLIAAAQAEGTISFVSGPGVEEDQPFFDAFGEIFGLDIENFGGPTPDVTARVSAERDQGIYDYDIGNLGGSGTENFIEAGFFEEDLESLFILPDLLAKKAFPMDYYPFVDTGHQCIYYAIEAEGNIGAFYYNTDTVSQEDYDSLNSWFDLTTNPRWKDRIIIGDINSGEASQDRALAWVLLGQEWFDGLLRDQTPTVMLYGSAREYTDALARGDFDIGLFPPGDAALQEAIDQGLPIAQMDKTMSEGSPRGTIQRTCIMKDAPHPNAAKLFLNWIFSEEGGTTYNATTGRSGRTHIRMDVPIGNIDPVVYEYAHNEDIPVLDELNDVLQAAFGESEAYLAAIFAELGIVPGG